MDSQLIDDYLHPHQSIIILGQGHNRFIDLLKTIDGIYIPEGAWRVLQRPYTTQCLMIWGSRLWEIFYLIGAFQLHRTINSFWRCCTLFSKNIFMFKTSHYLQMQGVVMGRLCALSYVYPYLGGWEWELFARDGLQGSLKKVISWHCYIDVIFLIWREMQF